MNRVQIQTMMKLVSAYAEKHATCQRRQVGCALVDKKGKLLSMGYNQPFDAYVNCKEKPCAGALLPRGEHTTAQGVCASTVHAEKAAMIGLEKTAKPTIAFVSCPPCKICIDLLIDLGCKTIVVPKEVLDRDNSEQSCKRNNVEWIKI